ncbi:SphA family protein [Oceanicoccus sagamiensis]|uniref:Phenol degradation protein meta n=1 Tax=Oceanicoccus sagamiensis TaxID=716816 RepID=A0A1X9NAP7_9GAMM|nr:transporter [Oceanicoccus sagamiensis]ARN73512.1 hypothetical protein BST96_04895 [Oceanicoccus sagamiensis]
MKTMQSVFPLFIASLCVVFPAGLYAEEGGSGHYQPGSMDSFADGVSPVPAFIVRLNGVGYDGDAGKNLAIPYAGSPTLGAEAEATVAALTLSWVPEWGVLNDTWTYQMSMTLPQMRIKVSGTVVDKTGNFSFTREVSDTETGLGDIVLMPLMLNQKISPDFNINYRIGLYAPTGDYKVGRLANTGKNYWTIEPTVGFMYFSPDNGREASVFIGVDFNEENSDTDYKTGTQVHMDATFAQHFPLAGGTFGLGLGAYYYEQVEGDSGDGAVFGSFKGKTTGLGPVLSYVDNAFGRKWISEFRWLKEHDVKNRLKGDILYLKTEMFF